MFRFIGTQQRLVEGKTWVSDCSQEGVALADIVNAFRAFLRLVSAGRFGRPWASGTGLACVECCRCDGSRVYAVFLFVPQCFSCRQ
mmetsp:Transcript_11899/g.29855  ORF Transcript_11899/g.29855 Transcript_11899/m.29855 type:complete len:86 (+) Transcript_11899:2464-2721(+)